MLSLRILSVIISEKNIGKAPSSREICGHSLDRLKYGFIYGQLKGNCADISVFSIQSHLHLSLSTAATLHASFIFKHSYNLFCLALSLNNFVSDMIESTMKYCKANKVLTTAVVSLATILLTFSIAGRPDRQEDKDGDKHLETKTDSVEKDSKIVACLSRVFIKPLDEVANAFLKCGELADSVLPASTPDFNLPSAKDVIIMAVNPSSNANNCTSTEDKDSPSIMPGNASNPTSASPLHLANDPVPNEYFEENLNEVAEQDGGSEIRSIFKQDNCEDEQPDPGISATVPNYPLRRTGLPVLE